MSLKPSILKQADLTRHETLPRQLDDGLVLRYATVADAEPLAEFNGWTHGRDHFDGMTAAYARDLCSASHPACGPSNITIVQDPASGKIVSTMCVIPQTWTYAGIPFDVGRIEAVGTAPAYRRRGLVRMQSDVLHDKSAAMGHRVQGITGIAWFYRQFGYEYALDLEAGRSILLAAIPPAPANEPEAYRLRSMQPGDLSLVQRLYDQCSARSLVACPRSSELWNYQLHGVSPASFEYRPFQIVETTEGRAVGYLAPSRELEHNAFSIAELEVVEGQSLRALMPSVFRALKGMGEAEAQAQNKTVKTLRFQLGREHPVYEAIPDSFTRTPRPYGWYLRVADVPSFLRHIAPALEARLAQSALAGHTGELRVSQYTDGWRIVLQQGRVVAVDAWTPPEGDEKSDAAFPPLTFLQLVFGYRSLGDLHAMFADCLVKDEAAVHLDILFPRRASHVIPIG